jgi:hypothetical protein
MSAAAATHYHVLCASVHYLFLYSMLLDTLCEAVMYALQFSSVVHVLIIQSLAIRVAVAER